MYTITIYQAEVGVKIVSVLEKWRKAQGAEQKAERFAN